MMRIAVLGSHPIEPFANHVSFRRVPLNIRSTWNVNLAQHLARIPDVEIHFLATAPLQLTKSIQTDGYTLHFVGHLPKLKFWDTLTRLRYSYYNYMRILKRIKPDVVHGSGTDHEYAFIATASPFPSLITVHGLMKEVVQKTALGRQAYYRMLAEYEEISIRRSKFLISISKYVTDAYPGYAGHTFNIPNAIDSLFFDATKTEQEDIVFVGKIIPRKRVDNLLRVVTHLLPEFPDIRVKIVGDIEDRPYYRELARYCDGHGMNKNVVFTDGLDQEQIAKQLSSAKMLVLPSIEETAPMACAEANACGTPAIATRVGGLEEMIEHGKTGFLVEPDNVNELEKHIRVLLTDNSLRAAMGKAAKEKSQERYHPEEIALQTYQAYQHVLSHWTW